MNRPIIIAGAGGHSRVLVAALKQVGCNILGITDPLEPNMTGEFEHINYLGNDEAIRQFSPAEVELVNGLGSVRNTQPRADLYLNFKTGAYSFTNVIHPASQILTQFQQGEGVQVMAGAIIGVETTLGHNVLINTGVIIEHGCRIGNHSHIASGAVVCGDCDIGEGVHVGAGATINQGIQIGGGVIIASGTVVTRSVPSGTLIAGVPGEIKRNLL